MIDDQDIQKPEITAHNIITSVMAEKNITIYQLAEITDVSLERLKSMMTKSIGVDTAELEKIAAYVKTPEIILIYRAIDKTQLDAEKRGLMKAVFQMLKVIYPQFKCEE